jgi:hypothetical protein
MTAETDDERDAGPGDPDVEEAWSREIARRVQELDASTVLVVTWADARRRIVGDR